MAPRISCMENAERWHLQYYDSSLGEHAIRPLGRVAAKRAELILRMDILVDREWNLTKPLGV